MAKKSASASEIVRKSNEKRGLKQVNLRLNPEEMAMLESLERPHGGKKGAIIAGLIKLKGGNDANSQAVAVMLRKMADEIDPKR